MKLSSLNTAIRQNEGPIKINLKIDKGEIVVALVKSELLETLKQFGKNDETGLWIDNGWLRHESNRPPS